MALKPVTDPGLLTALNTAPAPDPATVPGPKPVTDPALLAQLDAPAAPVKPDPLGANEVPIVGGPTLPDKAPPEQSVWDKFMSDPIIQMWGHGLKTAAMGAPETIMSVADNAATQGFAGLTAPFVTSNPDDQAGYIRDVTEQNFKAPQSEAGRQTFEALGEAFEPLGNIKRVLGETTLDATGSPLAATAADLAPDLALTMLGPKAGTGRVAEAPVGRGSVRYREPARPSEITDLGDDALSGGAEALPDITATPNPKIEDLRAADIRVRPSDVRAATPGKKTKVPGEKREKLADAPDLKKDTTLHNQQRYTDLAAEEVGVADLTAQSRTAAEAPAVATYEMVESVLKGRPMSGGFEKIMREALDTVKAERPRGETPTVLGTIGMLRRRANKRINSGNPESEAAGYADRNMADALDDALAAELEAAGEAQLVPQLKEARERFGKVHDIWDNVRADQIDAEALYRLDQKAPGRLSGRLKLISDAAQFLPNVSKHSTKTAARAEAEIPDTFMGNIKEWGKKAVRKIPGMDVGAPGFQDKFGTVNKARADSYGRKTKETPPREVTQGELNLDELMLDAPPGAVGKPAPREMGTQVDALADSFDLAPPSGNVGIRDPKPATNLSEVMIGDEALAEPIQNFSALSLEDLLGLSEPLVKKPRRGKK